MTHWSRNASPEASAAPRTTRSSDIRAFFSGAQILAEREHELEEGRSESNVEDEAIKAKA